MTEELTKSVETALSAFNEYKTMLEGIKTKQNSIDEKLDGYDKGKIDQLAKDIGAGIEVAQKAVAQAKAAEESQKALETQVKALEIAFNRPAAGGGTTEEKTEKLAELHKRAINDFARKGGDRTSFGDYLARKAEQEPEFKALSVGSDPNGGYLVSPEFGGIRKTKEFETSPLSMLASTVTISTNSYELVVDYDEASAGWVSETGSRSTTNTPTFGKINIPVYELYANPKATQTALDDAAIDLEGWLGEKVSDIFARTKATAFITGNGVGQPRGIMSYTAGTMLGSGQVQQVVTGDVSNFTYDGLVDLQNALKESYQGNAVFLTKRASCANLMKIKTGVGLPIFNMTFDKNVGLQPTIMGKPVYFANDVAAVAANALAMAYGDFKQAYQIVERKGITLLRDPYSDKPFVAFYTTARAGGATVNYEAYKIQKIAAS